MKTQGLAENRRKSLIAFLMAVIVVVVMLWPFAWMLSTSLKNPDEVYSRMPNWIPQNPTLQNYKHVWYETLFPRWFLNSLTVAVFTTLFSLILSVTASYTISRLKFRGRTLFSIWLLYTQMIPHVFLLLPLFVIIRKMGLINTFTSLVITNSTFALPFSVWMLKGYFDTIPRDLEDAARIDGCTYVGAMWRVIMPLSAPGIAAVGLYTFIVSWQEYMFSLTFARTTEMRTLPVGISLMLGDTRVLWGRLMAASVLVTLPVAIAFVYLQKHLVQGLTAGAVKG